MSLLRLLARIPGRVRLVICLGTVAVGLVLVVTAAAALLTGPTMAGRLWTVVAPGVLVLIGARGASQAIDDIDDEARRANRQPPPWR